MKTLPRLSPLMNLMMLVFLCTIWIALAPTQVGGRASYVIVNGNSMEPGFHRGDLVITHTVSNYKIGDVATYLNGEVHALVIHRIIRLEEGHYVFKGDNNAWIDNYRPTREELKGKLWIRVPRIGNTLIWLRLPLPLALAAGLLGGVFMASSLIKPNQRKTKVSISSAHITGMLEAGLYIFGGFAILSLALGILAFWRPLTRPTDDIQYKQESRFSYSALGTPVIYDTETVRSGEPVFPKLTCFLNVTFDYNLQSTGLQDASGTYELTAHVLDGNSGWSRTIPMSGPTAFNGNSLTANANLDLCQIVALVDILKQQTGLRSGNFTLEIIPKVMMNASMAGTPVVDTFEPKLVFEFDEVYFALSAPKGQDDPLYVTKAGSVGNPALTTNTFRLLAWQPSVWTVRLIAMFGFVLSLTGILWIASLFLRKRQQSQEEIIRLRYGDLLVNLHEQDPLPAIKIIDVTTIDELAKLAERQNTVILHMTSNFLHSYLVQCNGVTYRYLYSNDRPVVPAMEILPVQIIHGMTDTGKDNMDSQQQTEGELFKYVINKTRTEKTETRDTVVMKRIRL